MRKFAILFLLLTQIGFGQSREIKGVITDGEIPLAGAHILVKGTSIGTQANFDGEFILNVPDSLNIIVISYLGYVTKEIDVRTDFNENGEYALNETIPMEEHVISCYFYPQHIEIGYFGGLHNSELGFLIEYFDPYTFKLPIVPEIKFGYQTSSSGNHQIIGEFNLKDLFRISRHSFDVDISYNDIEVENNFSWESLEISAKTFIRTFRNRSTSFSLGVGRSILNSKTEFGVSMGLDQYLFKGIGVNSQITRWRNNWQVQSEITYRYEKLKLFYGFNTIDRYSEHNVGMVCFFNL